MRSKRNSISAALEENRADPRRFWRVINEDLGIGKKAGSSNCTKIRSEANEILQNEYVGDYLSKYYASNGTKLAESFQKEWDPRFKGIEGCLQCIICGINTSI